MVGDFSVQLSIFVIRGAKKSPEVPTVKMSFAVDCLHFRFTPSLYNHFVSISSAFYLSEDDEVWGELIRNKAEILKAQRMIGVLQMRGERLKQYWYRYYCCLSCGYLYFYETNSQEIPSSYFYLKNTQVLDGSEELKIEHTLILRNKSYQCCLAFKTGKECQRWRREIETVIKEISIFSEASSKKPVEAVDSHDVSNEVQMVIKKFVVEIFEENRKEFVSLGLSDTECLAVARAEDFALGIKVRSLELFHLNNKHFKKILYNEVFNNPLTIDIDMASKNSPRFKGELLTVEVDFGNLIAYYPPKVIKQLMTIMLDIAPKAKSKVNEEEEKKGEILKSSLPISEITSKLDTCKDFPETFTRITIKLNNSKLYCLHQRYDTLTYLLDVESATIEYSMFIDHYYTRCKLGTCSLFDLTNYPNTILPLDFFNENVKPQRLMQMLSNKGKDFDSCKADVVSYLKHCPNRPLDRENQMSATTVHIGTVKIDFYNECVSFRFMDYFFYQFLDSLSPRDNAAESLKMYEAKKQPHEGKDCYEIVYFTPFGSFEITIDQPLIYLKPRLHYKNYFLIDLGKIRFWNERQMSAGRWVKHPTKQVLCENYYIDMSALSISFNENFTMLEPSHFVLRVEMICMEAHDYNSHSPKYLDQSKHIQMQPPKILKLSMKPEHYTYFLKCLDLNINFTDNNADFFNFRQVNFDVIKGGINFIMKGAFPNISVLTLNSDSSVLAELIMKDVDLHWTSNNDYTKQITIQAADLYCLHEEDSECCKNIIIAPLFSTRAVQTDERFYSETGWKESGMEASMFEGGGRKCVRIGLKVLENWDKEWSVELERHKMFVELYFIMLLSHFFIEGFPDYKDSPEKPNECTFVHIKVDIDDIEKYPKSDYKLRLIDCLLLLPSENPSSTLILRGNYHIDYFTECVSRVKDELLRTCESSKRSKDKANEGKADEKKVDEGAETYGMSLELKDVHTFFCNVDGVNGQSIERVQKRKLLKPLNLLFSMKDYMCFDTEKKAFKTYGTTKFKGKELFMTISYQDIVNIANAFVYNMQMLDKEYFGKLTKFHKLRSQGLEISAIEELKDECMSMQSPANRNQSRIEAFELVLEKAKSEYTYQGTIPEDNIFTVLGKAFEELEQLGKASKAMSHYKSKAVEYTQLAMKSQSHSKLSDSLSAHRALEQKETLEEVKVIGDAEQYFRNMYKSSSQDLSTSNYGYERVYDATEINLLCIKIVSLEIIL